MSTTASRKRTYVADSEVSSLTEVERRRGRPSPVDDVVDFEVMLQDMTSVGESTNLTRADSQADGCSALPECVSVKTEPGCDTPEEQVLCLSVSSPQLGTSTPACDESDVECLRRELAAAVETNLALQEELSARDFHLAQLAEDFFCLHEQFKQLARHFQSVLGDIQPVADQSSVNKSCKQSHELKV